MFESINNDQTSETTSSNDAATSSEPQLPPTKKAKGLSKILGQCLGNSSSAALSVEQKVKQELDQYLSHSHLDVEESPTEWWKTESTRYPHVAQLARKHLYVQQAFPLNVFSAVGRISFLTKGHVLNQTK